MYLLDLFWGVKGEWGAVEIVRAFLGRFLLGDSNTKKQGDHRNKKFFINKSVKALILLKEGHKGLLKLHVPLKWKKNVRRHVGTY